METTSVIKIKNNSYLVLALTLFLGGCALHEEVAPKYVYIDRQQGLGIPVESGSATEQDIQKLGYKIPDATENEKLHRTYAACEVQCATAITTGGHATYDSRIACKKSCMRAQGWEFYVIDEVQK